MRLAVEKAWFPYSTKKEGYTPFPYCDTLNLVTTGVGNLKDASARNSFDISNAAMAPFLQLPWKYRAAGWSSKNPVVGGLASFPDVQEAFITCKLKEQQQPGFNKKGGFAYAGLTNISLSAEDVERLFMETTHRFESTLKTHLPNFDSAPADPQMAAMSMAWAMGPAFIPNLGFTQFQKDFTSENYQACMSSGQFKGGGALNDPNSRNNHNALMFGNGDRVKRSGGDREILYFPGISPSSVSVIPGPANPVSVDPKWFDSTNHKIIAGVSILGGLGALTFLGYELESRKKGR